MSGGGRRLESVPRLGPRWRALRVDRLRGANATRHAPGAAQGPGRTRDTIRGRSGSSSDRTGSREAHTLLAGSWRGWSGKGLTRGGGTNVTRR